MTLRNCYETKLIEYLDRVKDHEYVRQECIARCSRFIQHLIQLTELEYRHRIGYARMLLKHYRTEIEAFPIDQKFIGFKRKLNNVLEAIHTNYKNYYYIEHSKSVGECSICSLPATIVFNWCDGLVDGDVQPKFQKFFCEDHIEQIPKWSWPSLAEIKR